MACCSPSLLSSTSSSFPSNSTSDSPSTTTATARVRTFNSSRRNPRSLNFSPPRAMARGLISKQSSEGGSAEQFLDSNSLEEFIRFKRGNSGGGGGGDELQTSVVSYRKNFPWSLLQPFLQVDLVSTVHIADKEYFATLQKVLEPYDCVLYEVVANKESLESIGNSGALRKLKSSRSCSRSRRFSIIGFFQCQMARLLRFDFQPDSLDYQTENWYHADLDYETFKLLQLERGESIFSFARDLAVRSTKAIMRRPKDLGPWRSKLVWVSRVLPMPLIGLLIISSVCTDVGSPASESPELEALSRLDFGAAMKVFLAKTITAQFTQVKTDLAGESVIIGERNRAATEALRSAMDEGHNKIAILYGGGHMPDLGRRLKEELDLVPSQVQWLTAWSIRNRNPESSSLPFLTKMAEISGWPLNRYQTLALLIFSSVLALDLWFWELFFGTTASWLSDVVPQLFR